MYLVNFLHLSRIQETDISASANLLTGGRNQFDEPYDMISVDFQAMIENPAGISCFCLINDIISDGYCLNI